MIILLSSYPPGQPPVLYYYYYSFQWLTLLVTIIIIDYYYHTGTEYYNSQYYDWLFTCGRIRFYYSVSIIQTVQCVSTIVNNYHSVRLGFLSWLLLLPLLLRRDCDLNSSRTEKQVNTNFFQPDCHLICPTPKPRLSPSVKYQ